MSKMEYVKPADIEKRSFEIITEELGDRTFPPDIAPVVKRVIHTSADFDYADNLVFSEGAVARARKAIEAGAHIVTDTNMAKAGINKKILAQFGGEVHCFVADEDVAAEAKARGVTRSTVSMERAARLDVPLIFAIGNAPTALVEIRRLVDEGTLSPELVIGVPVGFVNVVESKELIVESGVPHIVARGRKGGSNVAAAIVNALLYQMVRREGF
ncbi:precorrin-8X methylmutase [Butyricicoccus sp.]|uniref:precorrin-8X methylmutase n=1 Tax=Butyricicoccus sp. TaxID=2049021 RepID=UPI00373707A1